MYFSSHNKYRNEYQGEQHYKPVNFGGCGDDVAKIRFQENIIRDEIKKEYCENNKMKLQNSAESPLL